MENYQPSMFADQPILCVEDRGSGVDLVRGISHHANHVYLSDTTCIDADVDGTQKSDVDSQGRVPFDCDCPYPTSDAATVICFSGYDHAFPLE